MPMKSGGPQSLGNRRWRGLGNVFNCLPVEVEEPARATVKTTGARTSHPPIRTPLRTPVSSPPTTFRQPAHPRPHLPSHVANPGTVRLMKKGGGAEGQSPGACPEPRRAGRPRPRRMRVSLRYEFFPLSGQEGALHKMFLMTKNLGWCGLNIGPLLPRPFASLRETVVRRLLVQGCQEGSQGDGRKSCLETSYR